MNDQAEAADSQVEDRDDWPNDVNVHRLERKVSRYVGGVLVVLGALRRGFVGMGVGLVGAALLERAATGHSRLYEKLRISTAHGRRGPSASVPHGQGIRVKRGISVRREQAEVFAYWRRLENLPIFMHNLENVTPLGEGRSHWRARMPFGPPLEWEAKIINEVEDELIAWRSLEGSQIHHAGSVRFERALGGRGTLVTVTMEYDPPAGLLGALAARLVGIDPALQLEADLRRFKMLLEAGDVPSENAEWRGRLSGITEVDEAREVLREETPDSPANEGDGVDDRRGVH